MTTAKLKENYEKHLEANWTRLGLAVFPNHTHPKFANNDICLVCGKPEHPPVREMGELGTRECGDWCKCFVEFEDEI